MTFEGTKFLVDRGYQFVQLRPQSCVAYLLAPELDRAEWRRCASLRDGGRTLRAWIEYVKPYPVIRLDSHVDKNSKWITTPVVHELLKETNETT